MAGEKALVLVIDDNDDARYATEKIVCLGQYFTFGVKSAEQGLIKARELKPAAVLCDVMMPEMDGYEFAKRLKIDAELRYLPLILVTAKDQLQDLVKGLDAGADDYITKPFKAEELLARVRAALRLRSIYGELEREKRKSFALAEELNGQRELVGESAEIKAVLSFIEKIKGSSAPVLVSGPSGTGKELVARAIHGASVRNAQAFIARNCAAMNENLLESELFGHVKGAFTGALRDHKGIFEAADGGTLFLDEIGEMSQALQAKLLRVLQEGLFNPVGSLEELKVDVRVIAATNRDLGKMVEGGAFREDLYYRLNVLTVEMPPLSQRSGDVAILAQHFVRAFNSKGGVVKTLSAEAIYCLRQYHWKGNVRELRNEIERAYILSSEEVTIEPEHLSQQVRAAHLASKSGTSEVSSYHRAMNELEEKLIRKALSDCGGNKSDAARVLGISRSNLLSKIQTYGIESGR